MTPEDQGETLAAVRKWAVAQARTAGRTGTVASAPRSRDSQPSGNAASIQVTDCTPEALVAATAAESREYQVYGVTSAALPGERLLIAAASLDRKVRIWDGESGELLHELSGHSSPVRALGWAAVPGGRLWLAAGSGDVAVHVWDGLTGELVHVLDGHIGGVRSVAVTVTSLQRVLIATGAEDGTVRIWDGAAGVLLSTLHGHDETVLSAAWGALPDGQALLATGSWDQTVRVWDGGTGALRHVLTGYDGGVTCLAWAVTRDGALLAAADTEGIARIWDGIAGTEVRELPQQETSAASAAWAVLPEPDGRAILATGNTNGLVRIWDSDGTALGEPLRCLPGDLDTVQLDMAVLGDGRVTLVTGGFNLRGRDMSGPTPLRVHDVMLPALTSSQSRSPTATGNPDVLAQLQVSATGLVALGAAGEWLPLGVVDDLVTLTGPRHATWPLHDPRLRSLADHPGLRMLRDLVWPAPARCALAGLLAADAATRLAGDPDDGTRSDRSLVAPPSKARLRYTVLSQVLDTAPGRPRLAEDTPARLGAAADLVNGRTLSLLAIIGPETAAADPALVLRVIHLRDALPVLPASSRALLNRAGRAEHALFITRSGGRGAVSAQDRHTADTVRHGPPTRLLLTQYALDPAVFAYRHAEQLLLYRQYTAPSSPEPHPITLVLDTTPPTFGPVEIVLRLAAQLMTTSLWRYGMHPALVTLDRPADLDLLDQPRQLLALWASRTLDAPDVATALSTAEQAGNPAVLLTHDRLVADLRLRATPRLQVLTTHPPGYPPRRPPASPWHHRLPPDPTAAVLGDMIVGILAASAEAAERATP